MSMTKQEVLALPVTVDLQTAAKALDIGRSMAYQLARANDLPIPVQKYGKTYKILRADLLRHLQIEDRDDSDHGNVVPMRSGR